MNTLLKADIFFFITSIAVVLITLSVIFVSFYAVKALEQARLALKEVEEHVGDTTEDVKDLILDLRESTIFRFLFRKKSRKLTRNNER
jgi:hypothetical protein